MYVQWMSTCEPADHEWSAEALALTDSGDAVDVCVKCGTLRYVAEGDVED
jgi:hypothetical protein